MKQILAALTFLVTLASCSQNVAKIDNSLKKHYDSAKVDGCFAFLNNQRGDVTVYNIEMDTQRVSPGEIFKIAEALIGVETGRLTDEQSTLKAGDTALDTVSLKEAFDNNNNAFLESLAHAIGADTMNHWLTTLTYGNMKAESIGSFWNNGELKISPDEQLGLMFKIYFDKLPMKKHSQQVVRNLMLKEDNTLYTLSYTTGKAQADDGSPLAWQAGWIEENRHVYFFVNLVKGRGGELDLEQKATHITRQILAGKNFFKGLN